MCRIQIVFIQVGTAHQDVQVVVPAVSQVMKENRRIYFVKYGIQIAFISGGCFERIIIKGKELGIIFFELGFGTGQHVIQLVIGIEIKIIMGNGILKKFPGNFPLRCGCFFIPEGSVLVPVWFFQVIIHPYLPGSVQIEK
jgi:hypothetical protein